MLPMAFFPGIYFQQILGSVKHASGEFYLLHRDALPRLGDNRS